MLKEVFKRNTHNLFFKGLAGFGRAMNRLYENRNRIIHSNGELTVLKKIAKTNPRLIIDGGANVGDYSIWINKTCKNCKIYSLEPVKTTFDKLSYNLRNFNNIIPVNKGLYSENCTKKINLFSCDEHSSIYNIQGLSYDIINTAEIELISGDNFLKNNGIEKVDFLKLDLEGAEFDAILGFENSIKNGAIKVIQFEYGYINITTKKLLIDFYNFFESYNYIVGKIFPKNVEFRKYEFKYEDFLGPNYIVVKKTETDLIELLKKK
jgi:FkbM family methyltransferase